MTSWVDALGNRFSYSYDVNSRRTNVVNPIGSTWTLGYDLNGRMITSADPLGNVTSFGYDAVGNKVSFDQSSWPGVHVGLRRRQPADWLRRSRWETGYHTTTTRRETGPRPPIRSEISGRAFTTSRLVRSPRSIPPGDRTSYTYNAANLPTAVTNPLANTASHTYDTLQRLVATVGPLGNRTSLGYDNAGNPVVFTNPLGAVFTGIYDSAGRRTARINPLGNAFSFGYDAANRWQSTTNPLGFTSTRVYDAVGRRVAQSRPARQQGKFRLRSSQSSD